MFIEVPERHRNVRRGRGEGIAIEVRLPNRQLNPNLDENHFLIDAQTGKCFDVVRIEMYNVDEEKTILYCAMVDVGGSMKERVTMVYNLMMEPTRTGGGPTPSYAETSGSRRTSTMDPALTMSLGMDKAASDIADDAHRHRRSDGSVSLVDAMRMAGAFDDDDDDEDY